MPPEQHASQTLLQQPLTLTIAGREYQVPPPTVATLVLVSEAVAQLPAVRLDSNAVAAEALAIARYARPLGRIAATLILGAKTIRQEDQQSAPRKWWKPWKHSPSTLERLASDILLTYSPEQLETLISQLLERMEIGSFFALTTFLTEVNLLRPTKVATEATASGQ